MASRPEYVAFVCDQLREAGEISSRKMFGEYGIYCDGKIVAMVCDDLFYVKKTAAGAPLVPGCPEGEPYPGAKPCLLIENPEDRELLGRLIRATWEELPFPKPKKKKEKSAKA